MTQFEKWDRLMQEDEDRRLRIARHREAALKRESLARAPENSKSAIPTVLQPPLRSGEGKIIHSANLCSTVIYYDDDDIDHIANRVPWLLRELMQELEENEHESQYPTAI